MEKVLQTVLLRRQRFLSTEFLQAGFLFLLVQGTCKQQSHRRHILFKGQKIVWQLKKGYPLFPNSWYDYISRKKIEYHIFHNKDTEA